MRGAPVALGVEAALANTKLFPYWLDNPAAPATEPELVGDATADLLIVGGGFTGLWAAVQAKEQMPHLNVVLIEAGKVAHGASGRAGGIISTSVMHGLPNAVRVFPNDIAQLEAFGHHNLDGFEDTLKRYDIDADIEWNGEMTVAVDPEHIAHLKGDYDLHREYGHNVVLLNREETLEQLNSPLFAGALWSRNRSGIVHPAKLAWGLKRAALTLGVRLYEHTPLVTVTDEGSTVFVTTPKGSVRAPRVVFGSGTAKVGIPDINRRVMQVRDHVLATEPLTDEQLARIGWKNRQGVYDTRTQLNYFRLTKHNNIIFGGLVSYHFDGDPEPHRTASAKPTTGSRKRSTARSRSCATCASRTRGAARSTTARAARYSRSARRQGRVRRRLYGLRRRGEPVRRVHGAEHPVRPRQPRAQARHREPGELYPARADALGRREDHVPCVRRRGCGRRLEARVDQRYQGDGLPDVAMTRWRGTMPAAAVATQKDDPQRTRSRRGHGETPDECSQPAG